MKHNPFKQLREKKGLSMNSFAALIGVSSAAVVFAESGAVTNPLKILEGIRKTKMANPEKLMQQYRLWKNSIVSHERKKNSIGRGAR